MNIGCQVMSTQKPMHIAHWEESVRNRTRRVPGHSLPRLVVHLLTNFLRKSWEKDLEKVC